MLGYDWVFPEFASVGGSGDSEWFDILSGAQVYGAHQFSQCIEGFIGEIWWHDVDTIGVGDSGE